VLTTEFARDEILRGKWGQASGISSKNKHKELHVKSQAKID
jgi:hypothetical protein